jgi:hypothetical protein
VELEPKEEGKENEEREKRELRTPILVTPMMEAIRSSEMSILTRATWCNFSEDGVLHSHRRGNLKSFILSKVAKCMPWNAFLATSNEFTSFADISNYKKVIPSTTSTYFCNSTYLPTNSLTYSGNEVLICSSVPHIWRYFPRRPITRLIGLSAKQQETGQENIGSHS